MFNFNKMSMSKKIYFVVSMLTIVATAIAFIGNRYLNSMNDRIESIVDVSAEKVKIGARINQNLFEISRGEKNILLAKTPEEMQSYADFLRTLKDELKTRREELAALVDADGKVLLDEFGTLWDEYLTVHEEVIQLAMLNSNVRAMELSQGKARDAYEKAETNLEKIIEENESEMASLNNVREMRKKAKKGSLATKISKNLVEMQRGEKNLILATTQEDMDAFAAAIESYEQELFSQLNDLRELIETNFEQQQVEAFENNFQEYATLSQQVRDLSRENGNSRAFDLAANRGRETLTEAEVKIRELVVLNEEQMAQDKAMSDANYAKASRWMFGVSVFGILGAVGLSIVIMYNLNKSMNKFIQWLSQGAEQTSSASSQVSASSQSLAEGASEQAASVEETSASLEEMGAMTRQNSESAREANSLASETLSSSEEGNQQMQQMLTAIQEVDESSEETSKIIKTIDEIAFQTNLLALNAAVEAARAGEAGQGFAVVADEVRSLAQRAAEAAKTTSNLIEGSKSSTKKSVEIVEKVAESLGQITDKVRKMDGLVGEITAASEEQTQGIDQVSTAMGQIDQVTQTIASNAEESASASEELNAQADTMMGTVQEMVVLIEGAKSADKLSTENDAKTYAENEANKKPKKQKKAEKSDWEKHEEQKYSQAEAEAAIPFDDEDDF